MANHRNPVFKGPNRIFKPVSRKTFHGRTPSQQVADKLQADARMERRMRFGMYANMLEFAGSLLDAKDQDDLAARFPQLVEEFYQYRLSINGQFPADVREEVHAFLEDLSAGAYDMAHYFFDCPGPFRQTLVNMVRAAVLEWQKTYVPTDEADSAPLQAAAAA